ncbi:double-stranded DNA binding protein [Perilla frutescens var. frutescens]|nr:double-stranded DNA binding protein [Perilla frutescens var. frutescens]
MSDSREESPDWLRSFQPPTESAIDLSSGSESPLDRQESDDEDNLNLSRLFKKEATLVLDIKDNDDGREIESNNPVKGKSPTKGAKAKQTPERKRKKKYASERGKRAKGKDTSGGNTPKKLGVSYEESDSIWSLSSDAESSPDGRPVKKSKTNKEELSASKDFNQDDKKETYDSLLDQDVESLKNQAPKVKSPVRKLEKEDEKSFEEKNINGIINGDNDTKENSVKEDAPGKRHGLQVSSSRLPLLLSEKVQRSKALVECEGDSIDLSGDVGSVGRIVISDDSSKKHEMFLDLKGTIYKTTIVPSRTFCVVSFGQSEAKIEAIMNDYIQLKPQSNIYEAETMVEGTLDGFSFDSEEEADKAIVEADQEEAAEEQPDGKTKRKPDKKPGLAKKKGKPVGEKLSKKMKKKPQVSKKGKSKK